MTTAPGTAAEALPAEGAQGPAPRAVVVKTMSDRSITIALGEHVRTVGDVKRALEERDTVPAAKQVLILRGRVLADNEPVSEEATPTLYLFHYEERAGAVDTIEGARDWDTKNRMKVFKAIYLFSRRNFADAAPLLVEAMSTFSEVGFIPFKECVKYALIAGMLVLDRPRIGALLIRSPEVVEVIAELSHMEKFITAFYNCKYSDFFAALAGLEDEFRGDWLVAPHTQFIIKEMRIRAYTQILASYKSVTIASMATSFGVSEAFVEDELVRFIAAGRLACHIDKVAGVVITSTPDARNAEYLAVVAEGDHLLVSMQKLGRLVSY